MRTLIAWLLLIASWSVAVDSAARAVWSWAKLGSFGYHVPWGLVAIVFAAGVVAIFLMRHRRLGLLLGALLPTAVLLVARHYP